MTVVTDAARLEAAVKPNDGFFTTFFVSPYSKYIARWAARRGIRPNAVTVTAMVLGVAAAALFATGDRAGLIAGAVVLQIAFTLDCVDGQLARYTGQLSRLGAWLDSIFDRAKEYVVFAGLAIGHGDVWLLAGAALALQTSRHMLDFSVRAVRPPAASTQRPTAWTWIKRIAGFPIGERFAAISVTAALWNAEVTFIVLLAWGVVGVVYVIAGNLRLRGGSPAVTVYRDDGPVARRISGGWPAPGLVRAVEYGGLLAMAEGSPAAFALLSALAYRHYDLVYRLSHQRATPPAWVGYLGGGWEGRLIVAAVLLATGVLTTGYAVAAAILGAVFVTESVVSWRRFIKDDQEDDE